MRLEPSGHGKVRMCERSEHVQNLRMGHCSDNNSLQCKADCNKHVHARIRFTVHGIKIEKRENHAIETKQGQCRIVTWVRRACEIKGMLHNRPLPLLLSSGIHKRQKIRPRARLNVRSQSDPQLNFSSAGARCVVKEQPIQRASK